MPTREMSAVGQLVCLLVLLCGSALSQSDGVVPSSPCPNVFQYVNERGGVYGRISIVPPLSFSRVKLQVQLITSYYPLVAGVGQVTVRGGDRELQEITNKASRNELQTIQFMVVFPPGQPIPRIAQIVINGRDFCPNHIEYTRPRGEINLSYEIVTSLPVAVAGGDQFYAPGTNPVYTETARPADRPVQNVRPANRPVQTPYEPQPIPTQFPSVVYQTYPTQIPYVEPESSTTKRPYVPPRTTKRPYVPPRTTQRPYEPPRTTQRPYEPPYRPQPTTKPKTPQKRPSSANNGQSEPRPGSQHRGCNVYSDDVINCHKRCDQLEENHKARIQRKDSIKLIFPTNTPLPPAVDIHSWISNTLEISQNDVDTLQLEEERFLVYIKMKPGALLADNDIVKRFNGKSELVSRDGHQYDVQLTYAGLGNRHVHVRNLPTEIENYRIQDKLEEYGAVFNLTDDFWTEEYAYKVKNGVRSVFIDLAKHIPSVIEIEEHNALITYVGQPKMHCDSCGSGSVELRSGCPTNSEMNVPYNTPSAY